MTIHAGEKNTCKIISKGWCWPVLKGIFGGYFEIASKIKLQAALRVAEKAFRASDHWGLTRGSSITDQTWDDNGSRPQNGLFGCGPYAHLLLGQVAQAPACGAPA